MCVCVALAVLPPCSPQLPRSARALSVSMRKCGRSPVLSFCHEGAPSRLLVLNSFHIFLSQFHCIVYFLTEAMHMHCKRFNQRFFRVMYCIRWVSVELTAFRGCSVTGKNRTTSFLPPAVHLGVFCCPATAPGACRAGDSPGSSVGGRLKASAPSSQRFLPCTLLLLAAIGTKHS